MNIANLLKEQVTDHGHRPAIIDCSRGTNRVISFAGMDQAASRIASQLLGAGLQRGDAVLLLQPVSAELYMLFTALLRSGLIAVFIDPAAGREHIARCCAVHPLKGFIGSARAHWLRAVSPALRRIPLKFSTDGPVIGARRLNHLHGEPDSSRIEDCSDGCPAMIRFTSGSTGQPKAAMRTHGFLLAQQSVLHRSFALAAGEIDLVTMPMFVLSNMAAGVTSLIPGVDLRAPGRIPPAILLKDIQRHQPQRITAAPALLGNLADHCLRQSLRLDGIQKIFTGGAPVFPGLLDKLHTLAPTADIVAVYGSTEAEPIALLHHKDLTGEDRSAMARGEGLLAGFPDQAIRLRILRGENRPGGGVFSPSGFESNGLPHGTPGQVVVAGPHVQTRYLNDPVAQQTGIHSDDLLWHQTGDAGFLDPKGRLWLLGRLSARIEDPHGILYPFQAECAAMEHPQVRRAAVLACQHRRILAIECSGEVDTGLMKSQMKWAGIDTIQIVRRLPVDKRHNSKIDYPALRSIFGKEPSR